VNDRTGSVSFCNLQLIDQRIKPLCDTGVFQVTLQSDALEWVMKYAGASKHNGL
jgi:hypothetical protein